MQTLYPMTGFGTDGMGAGGMGGMGNIPPQLLALLAARGGMGGGNQMPGAMPPGLGGGLGGPMPMGAQGAPNPMAQGGAPSPMANYMGAGGGMGGIPGGGMHPGGPQFAPVGQPQQQGFGALMQNPQMLQQLLSVLKGGQTGLAPVPGGTPPMTAPAAASMGMPQQMAPGMSNPGIDTWLRSLGMFGGATGGAPT